MILWIIFHEWHVESHNTAKLLQTVPDMIWSSFCNNYIFQSGSSMIASDNVIQKDMSTANKMMVYLGTWNWTICSRLVMISLPDWIHHGPNTDILYQVSLRLEPHAHTSKGLFLTSSHFVLRDQIGNKYVISQIEFQCDERAEWCNLAHVTLEVLLKIKLHIVKILITVHTCLSTLVNQLRHKLS